MQNWVVFLSVRSGVFIAALIHVQFQQGFLMDILRKFRRKKKESLSIASIQSGYNSVIFE